MRRVTGQRLEVRGQKLEVRKNLCFLSSIFYLLFSIFCFLSPARAADETVAHAPKVGVVDVAQVFDKYHRTNSQQTQFKELANTKQQEREQRVSEIRNLRDEMLLMNEQSRLERRSEMDGRLRDLSIFDQEAKETLHIERSDAVRLILGEIEQVVSVYSKEMGFDLVLTDRAAIFHVDAIDITGNIIQILNRRYSEERS